MEHRYSVCVAVSLLGWRPSTGSAQEEKKTPESEAELTNKEHILYNTHRATTALQVGPIHRVTTEQCAFE